jgi:hypothetical protein
MADNPQDLNTISSPQENMGNDIVKDIGNIVENDVDQLNTEQTIDQPVEPPVEPTSYPYTLDNSNTMNDLNSYPYESSSPTNSILLQPSVKKTKKTKPKSKTKKNNNALLRKISKSLKLSLKHMKNNLDKLSRYAEK